MRGKRQDFVKPVVTILITCLMLVFSTGILAKVFNYVKMPPGVHPIIDGECSFFEEWDSASPHINSEFGRRGAICRQYQVDWFATSSKGNNMVYPGVTLFEIHDFWDADSYEAEDLNKFHWEMKPTADNPNASLTVWVFDNKFNAPDDRTWLLADNAQGLPASKLIRPGPDHFDDRGFIVRINDDPKSDVQWFPGDPEPGDPTWSWATYYGFFGKFGFNDKSRLLNVSWTGNYVPIMGHMGSPWPNEVYEFALHGGIGGGKPNNSKPYEPCKHTFLVVTHYDPHGGTSYAYVTIIDGPGHIDQPRLPRPIIIIKPRRPRPLLPGPIQDHFGGNVNPGCFGEDNLQLSNIGDNPGNFIITITDENEWLEEPIVIKQKIEGNSTSLLRFEYQIPKDAEIGSINRFHFLAYAAENPDYIDETYTDYLVARPTENLIWLPPNVSSSSAYTISEILSTYGRGVKTTSNLMSIEDLDYYDVIWICLGMSSSNYTLKPGSPEFNAICNYLDSGGSIYMEGGDVWSNDESTLLNNYFHIESIGGGSNDLEEVIGYDMAHGYDFYYNVVSPSNSFDRIKPPNGDYQASLLFFNRDVGYGLGLAYNDPVLGYSTIGTSFEFGSLVDESSSSFRKYDLMNVLLCFLEPPVSIVLPHLPPFGSFDTPVDGSTVRSSIAVTGWALDDVSIESLKIYGEHGGNLFYIGDASFVEGARPDVAQAYPYYPNNTKAGWGYMMLTNFLPNGGNGSFTIYAIATDNEGNKVTLGTKNINVDNINAVKPFGSIDTPTQGGTASGSSFINWGWVLTPQPNHIATDGSTINVWVDGVNIGHPSYNIYRADIAALFPGYANSDGAAGYFYIETTAYWNGVHTIQWTATDSAGNTDGIGSRYFTIQNTDPAPNSVSGAKNRSQNISVPRIERWENLPIDQKIPVKIRKGFEEYIESRETYHDEDGLIKIETGELQRIELDFSDGMANNSKLYGYLVVGNRVNPLPTGTTLNSQKGKFYWLPGPGFVGEYRFVFIVKGQNAEMSRKNILVKILPKFGSSGEFVDNKKSK